jgi:hypothetical protein
MSIDGASRSLTSTTNCCSVLIVLLGGRPHASAAEKPLKRSQAALQATTLPGKLVCMRTAASEVAI